MEQFKQDRLQEYNIDGKGTGYYGLFIVKQFSDPKFVTMANADGIELLRKLESADFLNFCDFVINQNKIKKGKEYKENMQEGVNKVYNMLVDRVIEMPELIKEIPVTIPAAFNGLGEKIVSGYQSFVLDELERYPIGSDLSSFYSEVKKNVALIKDTIIKWLEQIEKSNQNRKKIIELFNQFGEEKAEEME